MLICDTHADTLWRMAEPEETAGRPFDITKEFLSAPEHTYVQALALYVSTGGMQRQPTVVEKELSAFAQLKAAGWHQIRNVEEAVPGQANVMLTIEGCEAFGGDPANVEKFAEMGVRMAALTWNNENEIAHPAKHGSKEGIKPQGWEILKAMASLKMAADTSHLNEAGFWDLIDRHSQPPMASHSCAKRLRPHFRNLTDEQIRAMVGRGGWIGVNFYPWFLTENGRAGVEDIVCHIDHMCQLGAQKHVGFGSDFDGIEITPHDCQSPADVPAILDGLRRRGYSEEALADIAGLNFLNYYRRLGW